MVTVQIVRDGNLTKKVEISGHADSGKYGQDLVCSAVSAISVGLLNAIDELESSTCEISIKDENHITINVVNSNETIQTILTVGIIQLKTIEESYPKNIKLKFTEV